MNKVFRGQLRWVMSTVVCVALAACGGGGGGGSASDGGTAAPAKVEVVTGDVQGQASAAQVTVYKVAADGARTALGSATTNGAGHFATSAKPAEGDLLMVEVTGGQYLDAQRGTRVDLPGPLRALAVWHVGTQVSVTAYSEVVVRGVAARAQASAPSTGVGTARAGRVRAMRAARAVASDGGSSGWTAAVLQAVNQEVIDNTDLIEVTNAALVDLGKPLGDTVTEADVALAVLAGGFDHFVARVAPGDLVQGVSKLYQLLLVDNDDDTLRPAFYAAMNDHVQTTALPSETRTAIRAWALLFQEVASEGELADAVPRGVASGGGVVVNDGRAWTRLGAPSLVNSEPAITTFNQRGALVAEGGASGLRGLHTASAAEVKADADVAVGRWNGGVVVTLTADPQGGYRSPRAEVLSTRGEAYALVKAPSDLPTCGQVATSVWGETADVSTGVPPSVVPAPVVAQQYAVAYVGGQGRVGAELSLRLASGEVLSFRTAGGAGSAWRSAIVADAQGFFEADLYPVQPSAATRDLRMTLKGRISGQGGRKVVMWQRLSSGDWMRVVVAQGSALDEGYCAVTGQAGTATLSPIPVAGNKVLEGFALGYSSSSDTAFPATFGSRGQLLSFGANGGMTLAADAQVYDLYGDDQLSIGRIVGNLTRNNVTQAEHSTYLVGQLSPVWPNGRQGTVTYTLQHATQGIFRPGGTGQPVGRTATIASATLTIRYDDSPYGKVTLQVQGTFDGQPFTYAQDRSSEGQIIEGLLSQGGRFSLFNGMKGFIAGDQAQRAGVHLIAQVEGGTLEMGLLLGR